MGRGDFNRQAWENAGRGPAPILMGCLQALGPGAGWGGVGGWAEGVPWSSGGWSGGPGHGGSVC